MNAGTIMKLSHRSKRVFAVLVLLVLLPVYIVVAVTLLGLFDRPHILLELGIYAGLGVLWVLPFRAVFRGVGREDPDKESRSSG